MSNRRVEAQINLKNLIHNMNTLHNHMHNETDIVAVIKADGYGHGSVKIGLELEKLDYIRGYAVATSEEALQLREAGLVKPIIILGYVFSEDYNELIEKNITFSIFDINSAAQLDDAAAIAGKKALVHIKVDTGMSRIGVSADDNGLSTVKEIIKFNNLSVNGIFTHFARADEENVDNANCQLNKFNSFVDLCKENGISFDFIHCSNSAGILHLPKSHKSFVRAGIVIYGLWPSNEMKYIDIDLLPVMSITSHIVYIKDIPAGTPVSYGGTYVSSTARRIATIPVGYADGYPRTLSNKGYVLINGQKAPIRGRVCMDQFMVDITDIDAKVNDEVVLLGSSGNERITAEYLGDLSGRFNYEFVCDISKRVPRVYI